ncbi:MAG: hypothetical protein ABH814_00920 [bacterium]
MEKIKEVVMDKIVKKEVSMKPRVYFILGGVLMGMGLGLVLLLAVFTANIGFYRLLFFGRFSLRVLPLIILFIGAGVALLKQYEFSYKRDFAKLAMLLVGGILLLGFVLSQTRVNQKAQRMRHLRIFYQNGQPLPSRPLK